MKLDDFLPAAQAPAVKLDDFLPKPAPAAAPAAPQKASLRLDDFVRKEPTPATSDGVRIDNSAVSGVDTGNPVEETLQRGAQGALKAIEPVTFPLRLTAAAAIKAIPGAEEQLNPGGELVELQSSYPFLKIPEVSFTDVSLYMAERYMGSDQEMIENFLKKGYSSQMAAMLTTAYKAVPAYVLGVTADWYGDPIGMAKFGQMNKATRTALRSGEDVAKVEKNFMELRRPAVPFLENVNDVASVEIKAPKLSLKKKAPEVPVATPPAPTPASEAQRQNAFLRLFDWRTGDLEIDHAATDLAGKKRGIPTTTHDDYFKPYLARGFSDGEDKLITQVQEAVPNLLPNIEITKPQSIKAVMALGIDEKALRTSAANELKRIQPDLDPRRAEAIVDQVVDNKRMSAQVLENRHAAGKLDLERDLGEQIIENYYTHKADPRALKKLRKKDKGLAAVMEQEELLTKEAEAIARAARLTGHDAGGYRRKLRTDVFEANAEMEKRTGIKSFFIENATIAGIMRLNESKSMLANKKFIDLLETKGFKFVERRRNNGTWERKFEAPAGWEHVADKVNYWFIPREHGNVAGAINAYNRVFRSLVLMRPDYHFQNYLEGWMKNFVQGIKIEDYTDTLKVLQGKGMVKVNGQMVPAAKLKRVVQEWGIQTGGSQAEAFQMAMQVAKKMSADGIVHKGSDSVKRLYKWYQDIGARGENWVRTSMFINRLKQGYNPKMAAFDVEKFHFDFTRTTKAMDFMRYFMPFIQAPLKTLRIAPEMIGANPRAYSFIQFQFMNAIERSFNDPTGADALYELSPGWRQFRDPIFGGTVSDLLGANSWVAAIVKNEGYQNKFGLPQDQMTQYLPIGMDVLNPLAVWEDQVMQGGIINGPVPSALSILLHGRDLFTGQEMAVGLEGATKFAHLMKEAGKSLLYTATGFPNTMKAIMQWYKVPDPEYLTPTAALLLHGSMGKFYRVDNVDREFLSKLKVLDYQRKKLYRDFTAMVTKEWQGRTMALGASGSGPLTREMVDKLETTTSRDIFNAYLNANADMVKALHAKKYLESRDPKELAAAIRGINKAVRELNENYVGIRHAILEAKRQGMADAEIERSAMESQGLVEEQPEAPEVEETEEELEE